MHKNYIRKYRKKAGISVRDLAIRVGCTDQTIYNLESGKISEAFFLLRKIAKQLGVSLAKLIPEK